MGDKHEKVTAILDYNRELVQAPEGSEGNTKTDPEGGTASVSHEEESAKSG